MGPQKNTDLEDFRLWLSAELKRQSALSHSADFATRKIALIRVEELIQAEKALTVFLSSPPPH
jgi:hypothetical protein